MGKGHHHHGGGYPPFSWSWGPGWGQWWDQPRSEIILVGDDNKDRDKILAYIASLPEKERGKAFEKFFGKKALSGDGPFGLFPTGFFDKPAVRIAIAAGGLYALWRLFKTGRRRYKRRREQKTLARVRAALKRRGGR